MGKYMGNSPFLSETDSLEFIPQADSSITTINTLFMSTTTPNTLKYTDSVGTLHTIEIPTMVVDSLNGLTGALSITTPNSTLTITNSSPNIELDINLANANTWSALQTFGNNISIGGAQFNIATLTTGNFLYYNGTNWINVIPITGTTLTETSGQLALNLANANTWTATQTFPANSIPVSATELAVNTTLTLSTNTLSINLANANTWTALQTFGNNISIGGAQFNIATLTVGNFLYYNGTNWINQSLASGSGISVSDYTISNSGVLSLNSLTGALDITTPNSTLTITNSSPDIELDINLANANTWTALQTFGVGLDVSASNNIIMNGIASTSTTATESSGYIDLLGSYYNGTTSVPIGYRIQSIITGTTPSSIFTISSNDNGTLTDILKINFNGNYNTVVGYAGLYSNTNGNYNTVVGYAALYSNTTSSNNSVFGYEALYSNTTGSNNSVFGFQALYNFNNTTTATAYITAIGYEAGYNYTGAETNNTILGAVPGVAGESNVIRIGNNNGTLLYGVETNTLATDYLLVNGNIQTPYSNNIIMNGIASTSSTTIENSGYIDLLGSYYNGTASVPYGFRLQSDITATTPSGQLNFDLNNNGTITTLISISQSGSLNLSTSQTTIAGATNGSIIASQPFQGTSYKKVVVYLSNYTNDTTTAQTYTYSTAFTNTPVISANNSGLTPTVSTTSISFNPDNTTVYTGFIILEGY